VTKPTSRFSISSSATIYRRRFPPPFTGELVA
jgi:hypothetical protein